MPNLFEYEQKLIDSGYNYVCGVDEAGRGPLAGPVCAGACIPDLSNIIEGVNDSKKLKRKEKPYMSNCLKVVFLIKRFLLIPKK